MCRNPSPARSGIGGCKRASRGFLLVEVLVSIVIISIGLLGLAGLHAVAMAKGNSGLLRSKATELGYAMADRIRVNLIASSAGAYTSMTPQSSLTDPGCISVNCTPAQLAVSDYVEWNTEVASALPQGAGVVCVDSTPDDGTPAAPACDGTHGSGFPVRLLERVAGLSPGRRVVVTRAGREHQRVVAGAAGRDRCDDGTHHDRRGACPDGNDGRVDRGPHRRCRQRAGYGRHRDGRELLHLRCVRNPGRPQPRGERPPPRRGPPGQRERRS